MNLKAHNKGVYGSGFLLQAQYRFFSTVYGFLRHFAEFYAFSHTEIPFVLCGLTR